MSKKFRATIKINKLTKMQNGIKNLHQVLKCWKT